MDTLPHIGDVIADRYRMVRLLGQGAYGKVYVADHLALGTTVAVKLLHPITAPERWARVAARFRREATQSARLSHANNVRVFDFGELPDGILYLVMEHIEGTTLAKTALPLDTETTLRVLAQCAGALGEAHRAGLIHRDVKPANLMLSWEAGRPRARVLDYGVSRVLGEESGYTDQGEFVGTVAYGAPEQFRSSKVDGRADVFALGVVTYELLTGHRPFDADAPAELIGNILGAPMAPLPSHVDPALAALVEHMLAKHPDDRPSTMDAVERRARDILRAYQTRDLPAVTPPDDEVTVTGGGPHFTVPQLDDNGTAHADAEPVTRTDPDGVPTPSPVTAKKYGVLAVALGGVALVALATVLLTQPRSSAPASFAPTETTPSGPSAGLPAAPSIETPTPVTDGHDAPSIARAVAFGGETLWRAWASTDAHVRALRVAATTAAVAAAVGPSTTDPPPSSGTERTVPPARHTDRVITSGSPRTVDTPPHEDPPTETNRADAFTQRVLSAQPPNAGANDAP